MSRWAFLLLLIWAGACQSPATKSEPDKDQKPTVESPPEMESPRPLAELLDEAESYLAQKNYREARFSLQRALRQDSNSARAFNLYGQVFYALNNTEEAKNKWQRCRQIEPQEVECRLNLAQLWIALKLYKNALPPLNEVIENHPAEARAYFYKGLVFRSGLKDTAVALQYFQKAIDLKQDYFEALDLMGVTLAARADSLAPLYYRRALEVQPQNADLHYKLGVYYMQQDEINQALEAYTKATQVDPRHADSYYNMGYMMIELREFRQAERYFSQAIASRERNYKALYGRAYALEMLGDVTNATKDYQEVLRLVPNYPPAVTGLQRIRSMGS